MLKVIVVATALLPVNALAAYKDGNLLYQDCQVSKAVALGYVLGVYDNATDGSPFLDESGKIVVAKQKICAPKNVIAGQIVDVSCAYLRDNPHERHLSAASLVRYALIKAFPCY